MDEQEQGQADDTDIAEAMVQADLDQLRGFTPPGLHELLQTMTPEQNEAFTKQMWRQRYPQMMLCGAAGLATEIAMGYQQMQQVGASPLTFQQVVLQLVNDVLMAHEGHHDEMRSTLIVPGHN